MNKPLIALTLLTLTLPAACSGTEEPPDPLRNAQGFCQEWAKAACQPSVVENCDTEKDDCIATQSQFCETIVPEEYSRRKASACLSAVKTAYRDAKLTGDEVQIVRYLAAPCDQLSSGTRDAGESCNSNDECDTSLGFACITKLGSSDGICEKPDVVGPGQACDGDAEVCEEGYFCNGDNCVAYEELGEACDGDYECAPEHRCVAPAASGAGGAGGGSGEAEPAVCTERAGLNDVCTSDDDCQTHYCYKETGATEGECASTITLSRSEPLCDDLQ